MGGSVGLKGTDGDKYRQALALGAEPVSPARTREFLDHLACQDRIRLLVAPGAMGEDVVATSGIEVIGHLGARSSPQDTKRIAREMLEAGAELIVFAGGDGTARDMVDAIDQRIPVIAIPAGVKIYSSVFAYSPRAAAGLLDAFVSDAGIGEEEVLDIDERAFREGRVDSRHYGFLLVPEVEQLLQGGKESSGMTGSTDAAKRDLAAAVADDMQPGVLYLLGSGTTVRCLADALGVEKTLLGIDAVADGRLVASDVNERDILGLLERFSNACIVVTPLGGNGFLFGRGNKQFTPAVLRKIGIDNIVVMAHRDKLTKLTELHVDTGDADLDRLLSGFVSVVVGSAHRKIMRVRS